MGLISKAWPNLRSTAFRQSLKVSIPWVVCSPLVNFAEWIILPVTINLGPGVYSCYAYANILTGMLLSVLVTPVADALAPFLAEHGPSAQGGVGNQAWQRAGAERIRSGFRTSLALGLVVTCIAVVASGPLVGLVYFHGSLQREDAKVIRQLTVILGMSTCFRAIILFFNRLFQARLSMINYVIAQAADPALRLLLILALVPKLGIFGIAAATSISVAGVALVSFWRGRKIVGAAPFCLDTEMRHWMLAVGAIVLVGAVTSGGIQPTVIRNALLTVALGSLALGACLGLGYLFRVREMNTLRDLAFSSIRHLKVRSRGSV